MKPDFQLRSEQIEPAAFLADESVGFRPLALRPGFGKTCLGIHTIVKLGYRAIIVLGMLIDQWMQSILQFTTLTREDIYVVKGIDSLVDLWKMIDGGFKPSIILFSTRTLDLYAVERAEGYKNLRSYNELCEVLGIGIKIIDECHLRFATNSQIDFRSNIKMNIYLSATYNHAMYEKYICRQHKYLNMFFDNVIEPTLYQYFFSVRTTKEQHCLILCQSRKFSIILADKLANELDPEESISVFFSGDKEFGDEDRLKSNIIVSTIQSCGTGRDIKGLKTCINTVSMASIPQTIQCLGRLREIPGEDTFYIDMCNDEIMSQVNHARVRLDVYRTKAKDVNEISL